MSTSRYAYQGESVRAASGMIHWFSPRTSQVLTGGRVRLTCGYEVPFSTYEKVSTNPDHVECKSCLRKLQS